MTTTFNRLPDPDVTPACTSRQLPDQPSTLPQIQLRRADWRFLLPSPANGTFEHLVLAGGPDGLGERLITARVARRVSYAVPEHLCADAVVLLGGRVTHTDLERAARALLPGGVMYCEIDRRGIGTLMMSPALLRKRFRAIGMTPISLYWPVPGFSECKRYIPVDVAGAMRWYATTLHTSSTRWHHVLKAVFRKLTRGYRGDNVARLLPWYAVIAVAGEHAPSASTLLDNDAMPEQLQDADPRPLLLTSGQDDGSRVVMIPFGSRSATPVAVVKASRLPDFNTNVEGEQRTLKSLRERCDPAIARGIPEPLGSFRHGEIAVGVESCAAGQSLFDANVRWDATAPEKIDNLRLASQWLTTFHLQTRSRLPASTSADLVRRATRVFERFSDGFDAVPVERHLFSLILERLASHENQALPFVWQHNDFGPWNIYRQAHDITVIDWEVGWGPGFDITGPPLCDLLYLVTHWSYSARRLFTPASEMQGFDELFLAPGRGDEYVNAARGCIADYLGALEIDQRFVPILMVYTWTERAVKRLDRRTVLDSVGDSARNGDQFVAYVSHLANQWQRLETSDFLNRSEIGGHA